MKIRCALALCVLLAAGCATRKTEPLATASIAPTSAPAVTSTNTLTAPASASVTASAATTPAANAWIIGEWTEDFGADGFGRSTFNADGTYSGQFYETPISTVPLVTFAGVWKIEGDALTYTLTACSDSEYLRTSPVTKDRIIKIEADRFTYLDAEQAEWTMIRAKPKQ